MSDRRAMAASLLTQAGIDFRPGEDGEHLVVAGRYIFWPDTALWQAPGDKTHTSGLVALIDRIRQTTEKAT